MFKIRRIEKGIELFDNFNFYDRVSFTKTTWEIIKLIKKHGEEKAVQKIMKKFKIDKKNAKEDINTILTNLKKLKIKLDDIPYTVSNKKYAPRTIHFDITHKCNSKCIYCLASDRMKEPGELSTKQILNIIDQMQEMGTWLLCLSGGEPFLRKDIFKILDHIEKLQLLTQVYTNGLLITKNVAKKLSKYRYVFLQVSLDSCIPEHHNINRGFKGAYEKTMKGLKNLLSFGVNTEVATILTKYNYKDVEKTAEFLHKLGIKNIRIGPATPFCGEGSKRKDDIILNNNHNRLMGNKIIELNKKYKGSLWLYPTREFIVFSYDYTSKEKLSKCGNSRQVLYINSNGLVYPCIFLVEPQFVIGDAKKVSLKYIWENSSLIKKIRYLSVEDIEKCKTCDVKHLCSGGCRTSAYYHFGSIYAHDPYFCALFNKNERKAWG